MEDELILVNLDEDKVMNRPNKEAQNRKDESILTQAEKVILCIILNIYIQ